MKRVVTIMLALILFSVVTSFAGSVSFSLDNGPYNSVSGPRLRHPIYDAVSINGDQLLEFSWWNDVTNTSGYILKIYKGYNMYADNLILKESLPADCGSFKAKGNLFENGKVYTWSIVRISFSGFKSDKSFNSFKVIKK